MKITRKEWKVLDEVLGEFSRNPGQRPKHDKARPTEGQVIASNLLARFREELSFPKGVKP